MRFIKGVEGDNGNRNCEDVDNNYSMKHFPKFFIFVEINEIV